MDNDTIQTIKQLCVKSVEAGISKLCQDGVWPRPPVARRMRVGYDFYRNQLSEIPQVRDLLTYLADNGIIKSIYSQSSSTPELHILYEYWEQLLLKILYETEGTTLSRRLFIKWFKRFIKELFSELAIWRSVDTISGLMLNASILKFDKATVLTSTPAHRVERDIWGEDRFYSDWSGIGLDKATLMTTVTIPKREYAFLGTPPPHLTKHIEHSLSVIDAIRLAKNGVPRFHCFAEYQISDFPAHEPLGYSRREGNRMMYENDTIVNKSDFKKIKQIWQERMKIRSEYSHTRRTSSNAMDTACQRFFRSYSLQNWLDSIVDLTIALEALFNPDENQELKHRISLRAAWVLDSSEPVYEEVGIQNRIYNLVRTMYDIRSSRVHGGRPDERKIHRWIATLSGEEYDYSKESQQLESALEASRDIVRRAIEACTRLYKRDEGPTWPFPQGFDENIVIAGQQKIWQRAAGIRRR